MPMRLDEQAEPPRRRPRVSRRRVVSGIVAAAALAACSGSDLPNPQVDTDSLEAREPMDMVPLALTNLRLPGAPDDPVAITVRGRRIIAVGQAPEEDVEILDLGGGFVIPGVIDSHVHLQFAAPQDILAGGVTAVRDLGGPPGSAEGVRGSGSPLKVFLAGRILTPVGGYPTRSWGADGTGREVTDAEDALIAVDEQAGVGATVIKVAMEDAGGGPLFDLPTLQAIVGQARAAGLRVTAHCGSAEALDRCIEAGVRELCHLPLHAVTPAEMVRAAEAAMVLVPTLQIREGDDPEALRAFAAFREAGGEVLYGSDLGNGGTAPGIETREVELMLAGGMTPEEVLRSATSDPALYLGLDTGRLEPGLVADLVVLGADPFDDHRAYDDVRLVMAAGQIVHRA